MFYFKMKEIHIQRAIFNMELYSYSTEVETLLSKIQTNEVTVVALSPRCHRIVASLPHQTKPQWCNGIRVNYMALSEFHRK